MKLPAIAISLYCLAALTAFVDGSLAFAGFVVAWLTWIVEAGDDARLGSRLIHRLLRFLYTR